MMKTRFFQLLRWCKAHPEAVWRVWLSALLVWLTLEIREVGRCMPDSPSEFVEIHQGKYSVPLEVKIVP